MKHALAQHSSKCGGALWIDGRTLPVVWAPPIGEAAAVYSFRPLGPWSGCTPLAMTASTATGGQRALLPASTRP